MDNPFSSSRMKRFESTETWSRREYLLIQCLAIVIHAMGDSFEFTEADFHEKFQMATEYNDDWKEGDKMVWKKLTVRLTPAGWEPPAQAPAEAP